MHTTETDIKMRILLAAKKLFARQGFEATTVRQICQEACANVALVSYHFGGKENVFNALFETFFPNEIVADYRSEQLEPEEGVRLIVRGVTEFRMREPELIALLQQEIAVMSPRIGKIREHAFPVWEILRQLLGRGREQGKFRFRSLDDTLLTVLGSLLFHKQSYYFQPLMVGDALNPEAFIEELTTYVLRGLGCVECGGGG